MLSWGTLCVDPQVSDQFFLFSRSWSGGLWAVLSVAAWGEWGLMGSTLSGCLGGGSVTELVMS